ncbi:MAG: 30S ribosomal protein S5 [DPANN group archaeon]|nr:30S ribosomal protein S5 [DPANN group archaeon]
MVEQKKVYAAEGQATPAEAEKPASQHAQRRPPAVDFDAWRPKTELGRKVKANEIENINQILDKGIRIRETEVVDKLVPGIAVEYVMIGQAHGKFGGGKRRMIRQTQKKTAEGNKPNFSAMCMVGNQSGAVGIGLSRAKEAVSAKGKSLHAAKLGLIKIQMGCGSWKCGCGLPHSLPFEITGKSGSVEIKLMPAPKGTGLAADDEIKKLLGVAGLKDVWSKTWGQTRHKINLINAAFEALKKLASTKSLKQARQQ